jgi:hypothetical protein
MVTRSRIADVLHAGIGASYLEPVPFAHVQQTIDQVLEQIASGELPKRVLTHHCQGLREWLGLPTDKWTDAAEEAAQRGREICRARTTSPRTERSAATGYGKNR